jgi:RNA polymerase sigma-70 factor (ECF subfamily)
VTDFPDTRDSLLVQVRSAENRQAWNEFVSMYRPVIYRLARHKGLQDADAQDLIQQVFMAVASSISRWERNHESVRFRNWLGRVARNAIINALARQPRDRGAGSSSVQMLLADHPNTSSADEIQLNQEYRREIFARAAREVQGCIAAETWRAFEATVVQGQSIVEVAAELGKPVGSIYAARSRVMRQLREAVRELEKSDE